MRPDPWPLLHRLIRHSTADNSDPVSDAELLARFARDRDQAAFELLVWRHGPMVLGACRRVLRDAHLADDAFQATFLVLARKAGSVRTGGSVAGWLHRVARRVAVRAARQRKARREEPLAADRAGRPGATPDPELRAVLDAEIDRLPDRFRLPVVLCYLDGRSTEDASRLLGVPRGTVLSPAGDRPAAARGPADPPRHHRAGHAAGGRRVGDRGGLHRCSDGVRVAGRPVRVRGCDGRIRSSGRKGPSHGHAETGGGVGGGDPDDRRTRDRHRFGGRRPGAGRGRSPSGRPQPGPARQTPAGEKGRTEEDRRKALRDTIARLKQEMNELDRQAELYQQELTKVQAEQPNPAILQSLGAVLTEVELTIFRTEIEVMTEKGQRLAQAEAEFNEVRAKPIEPQFIEQKAERDPAVVRLKRDMADSGAKLREFRDRPAVETPSVQRKEQIADLEKQLAHLEKQLAQARLNAKATAANEMIEAATRAAKVKLDDTKRSVENKEKVLHAARQKRSEIIDKLAKVDKQTHSAEVRRLTAELEANREVARQLARMLLALELEQKGLPVPDAGRVPAGDEKMDRILRELAELRAEMRKLSEKK
jgi:RNA polymerase sigma factor (sigma-70 family)